MAAAVENSREKKGWRRRRRRGMVGRLQAEMWDSRWFSGVVGGEEAGGGGGGGGD